MKKIIMFFLLLNSCSNMSVEQNNIIKDIDLDKNLSFLEFKNKIIQYANESDYPDIN